MDTINRISTVNLKKYIKQIKLSISLHTYAHFSELPSNIRTMTSNVWGKYISIENGPLQWSVCELPNF